MNAPPASKLTTVERVAVELREDILGGKLAPGAPLREEELARAHGASRHIVRETLRLLAAEGLAEYSAFKGARVSLVSHEDVRDVYATRRFFEVESLKKLDLEAMQQLARVHGQFADAVNREAWDEAFQLDVAFHGAIVAAAGSRRMLSWHAELFRSLSLAHLVSPAFREEGLRASVTEHAALIVALAAGDVATAEAALKDHLDHAEHLLTQRITQTQRPAVERRARSERVPESSGE